MHERDLSSISFVSSGNLKLGLRKRDIDREALSLGHLDVAWQVTYRNCHNR